MSDISGKLKGKPVKIMTYDSATKILTVRSQSKGSIEKRDITMSLAAFVLGTLLILAGLAYFKTI